MNINILGKNNLAFTMVELMVTVSLVAVLAVMAFANYQAIIAEIYDKERWHYLKNLRTALDGRDINNASALSNPTWFYWEYQYGSGARSGNYPDGIAPGFRIETDGTWFWQAAVYNCDIVAVGATCLMARVGNCTDGYWLNYRHNKGGTTQTHYWYQQWLKDQC